jgi:hypothetical protein
MAFLFGTLIVGAGVVFWVLRAPEPETGPGTDAAAEPALPDPPEATASSAAADGVDVELREPVGGAR